VNLGLVQFAPEKWDTKGNWSKLKDTLGGAVRGDLDLVITPECIVDGYVVSEATKDVGGWADQEKWLNECALDPLNSVIIREAGAMARELGAYLVLGFTELTGPGRAANAAGVFDREGQLVTTYHKTHLQNHDLQFEPGKSWTIVDADFGRFGVLICADRRWPEAVRCQRLLGAEFVANPTYGMHGDLNLAMMRTRAYENGFFIAFAHPKQSLVTGPSGEVAVDARDQEALVRHTIDLDLTSQSHINDRRTDLYSDCLGK
jgi:predicted amidohydrolase